jgi:hypothetical protein
MSRWFAALPGRLFLLVMLGGSALITSASLVYFEFGTLPPLVIQKLPVRFEALWLASLRVHVACAALTFPLCLLLMTRALQTATGVASLARAARGDGRSVCARALGHRPFIRREGRQARDRRLSAIGCGLRTRTLPTPCKTLEECVREVKALAPSDSRARHW